jgi:hypothetical protein
MVTTHVDRSAKTTYSRIAAGGLIAMRATGLPDWLDRARPHDPTPVSRHLVYARHDPAISEVATLGTGPPGLFLRPGSFPVRAAGRVDG